MTVIAANPIRRRWTSQEYHRMGEAGLFRDQRVELINGEVLAMAPQGSEHFAAICLAAEACRKLFAAGYVVRVQGPLAVAEESEPEPDIAVVKGNARDYAGKSHPSTALLVMEISDSSLEFDRRDKGSLYASAAVADYWIVNLIDRQVEVYRRSVADPTARFGFRYAERQDFTVAQNIQPLSAVGNIAVPDLLP